MASKVAMRRESQLNALIDAAEKRIKLHGAAGVKARDLAGEIGVAVGAIYNLVADLDELVLRVSARTLNRLDATLLEAVPQSAPRTRQEATERLIAIALAYRRFAMENLLLWRDLFEHRMQANSKLAEWALGNEVRLFRHICEPLQILMPKVDGQELYLMARTLFSAVHGIVSFGLEDRNVAVPLNAQEAQIVNLIRIICKGLH
jgi:AcrR family transcriptional regulator